MSDEKIKGTYTLKEAILDAERLLSYASESGIELDPKYIKAIITAKKNNQVNEWTEQDEIDFWIAFKTLAKAVSPVSIDSLRAASVPENSKLKWWKKIWGSNPKSLVERSVSLYRRLALFFMFIMLVIQIYSLIGTALMSKWNSGDMRMAEIQLRKNSLMLITSSNPNDHSAGMEQTSLETEEGELEEEVRSSIELLDGWLNVTYNFWSKTKKEHMDVAKKELSPAGGPPFATGSIEASANVYVIQQAKNLITILNQYLLPLLYGLLGGFAFVLRSLAEESKNMTYTPTSKIKYGLRIQLGALAGLVIGFLWGDFQGKSFGVVESLSPLAVAFLAGYSVDFIFRMLDSLIANTGKKADAGGDSGEKNKKK